MAEPLPTPIVFPCPTCRQAVVVDRSDRKLVRPVGSRKATALLVRTECPHCRRQIVCTVLAGPPQAGG